MGKKKKTYKVSSKPKVAAMNEYIYNTLKDDLAKEYTANKPRKPKAVYKAQVAKRTNLKIMQGEPERYKPKPKVKTFREAGSKYGTGFKSKGGRPLPASTSFTKIDSVRTTKLLKQSGFGIGEPMNTTSVSKKAFGIKPDKVVKGVTRRTGDHIGYKIANTQMDSQITPPKQKIKPSAGKLLRYKSGTYSPLNKTVIKQSRQAVSATAKKALITRGAKLAAKGATRLIPGVGTAMLAADVYNVLTKSKATKYVPQFGASNVSKKYKKGRNY